jgi:hypothetical protein
MNKKEIYTFHEVINTQNQGIFQKIKMLYNYKVLQVVKEIIDFRLCIDYICFIKNDKLTSEKSDLHEK